MTSNESNAADTQDDHRRLLVLLNEYGISENAQRLLALQLTGGCIYTHGERHIRGEINMALFVGSEANQSGLLETLTAISPGSTTINATGASYGGLIANASGQSVEPGILLDDQYDRYFIHRAGDLGERTRRALSGLLESGTHTITKSNVHKRLENHASYLLTDTPRYGDWDKYEPLSDQLPITGELLSKFDLVVASHESGRVNYGVDPLTRDAATQYLSGVRSITPAFSEDVREELTTRLVSLQERLDDDRPPVKLQFHSFRRFVDAAARLERSETVEPHHIEYATSLIEEAFEDLGILTVPEEEEYDVDVIETGRSKTQRDRVKGIKQIIRELQEEYDGEPGVPEEKVYQRAEESGLERNKAENEIQKLKNKGDAYSPIEDYLRLV
ncbi:minichromosome maintenance protein MCM [Halalkalicoccus ordinarius]|uniref:hypothetical protein n=1 Tax=Halalkalicoccus ordinarius TaxID=3116651 RepID=UPI00300E8907